MSDDLVRRLKSPEIFIGSGGVIEGFAHEVAKEAADLIEAQAAEIARFKAWRTAINDALTNWLDPLLDDETPKDALRRLIQYEITAALDPAVSQSAADLVATARREGMEEAVSEAQARAKFWVSGNNEEAKIRYDEARKIAAAIRAAAKEGKP